MRERQSEIDSGEIRGRRHHYYEVGTTEETRPVKADEPQQDLLQRRRRERYNQGNFAGGRDPAQSQERRAGKERSQATHQR